MKRISRLFALFLLMTLITTLLTSCSRGIDVLNSKPAPKGEYPVTVASVEISAQPAKVVILSDNLADVVLALSEEESIAAVSNTCTQSDLNLLTKVAIEDVDAIKAVSPDLVLAAPLNDDQRSALQAAQLKVIEITPAVSREDYERLFGEVSAVFQGSGAGYELGVAAARKIFNTMDSIQRQTEKDTITKACYLYDTKSKGITGDQFGTVLMKYAGLTNILSDSRSGHRNGEYALDMLIFADPDIIFCAPGVKTEIEASSDFSALSAVRNHKVFELETEYLERQGRTIVTASLAMVELAFPELMETTSKEVADPVDKIESEVKNELSSSQSSTAESSESSSENYIELKEGDYGDDVYKMQERLTALGYLETEYDGSYGQYTVQAVKDFQKAHKLTESGNADADTLTRLYSADAKKKA